MKILLTGATGQVGWELARTLVTLGEVVAPGRDRLDLSRPASLAAIVQDVRPAVIVNAAAYTAVDRAEQEPALATSLNADAPAALARAARAHGALLVHYSTDYVFDGSKAAPYAEDDAPRPLSVYGRTKLAGETAVRDSGADYLILRTSWVYAARGRNFLRTMLQLALTREQLRVVNDQTGAPTWARFIAQTTAVALHEDLARRRRGAFESAVVHLTASGATTWHGFASTIVERARARGAPLVCREVRPIATSEYPTPAARPANSRLNATRLAERYGMEMPPWETGLDLCLEEMFPAER